MRNFCQFSLQKIVQKDNSFLSPAVTENGNKWQTPHVMYIIKSVSLHVCLHVWGMLCVCVCGCPFVCVWTEKRSQGIYIEKTCIPLLTCCIFFQWLAAQTSTLLWTRTAKGKGRSCWWCVTTQARPSLCHVTDTNGKGSSKTAHKVGATWKPQDKLAGKKPFSQHKNTGTKAEKLLINSNAKWQIRMKALSYDNRLLTKIIIRHSRGKYCNPQLSEDEEAASCGYFASWIMCWLSFSAWCWYGRNGNRCGIASYRLALDSSCLLFTWISFHVKSIRFSFENLWFYHFCSEIKKH